MAVRDMAVQPIILDPRREWQTRLLPDCRLYFLGDEAPVIAAIQSYLSGGMDALKVSLRDSIGQFGAIADTGHAVVAFTDHCRTIPIFYHSSGRVSNDARLLVGDDDIAAIDKDSILEIGMAGFVTGPFTVDRRVRQVQCGEIISISPDGRVETEVYYTYLPQALRPEGPEQLSEELGPLLDRVIRRVIAAADGRPVWVPLSGGLDSRLLLCKLVEHGCQNLQSFSYGPPGNDESIIAKRVASRLGVPWRFVPSHRRAMQDYFHSSLRHDYWRYADGLAAAPNPQDILPLVQLLAEGVINRGDFVVNGQTGDFICGGHIPKALLVPQVTFEDLFQAIVRKHYSLWAAAKTSEALDRLRGRVARDLGLSGNEVMEGQDACALYELWEYRGRQSKFIIAGQRIYDFLGLNWRLPLWDQEYVSFWRDIPAAVKCDKKLYRRYLDHYDFKQLFKGYQATVWQWPGFMKAILVASRLIRLTLGVEARDRFLRASLYFGMYRHLYAPYRYLDFLKNAQNLRNPISLLVATWLAENGYECPNVPKL